MNLNKLFFTADHHFGHRNIIAYEERPFENRDEMDLELIKRWNDKVPKDGIVYHLGDISFSSVERTREILSRLHDKIYYIHGNNEPVKPDGKPRSSKKPRWRNCYYNI